VATKKVTIIVSKDMKEWVLDLVAARQSYQCASAARLLTVIRKMMTTVRPTLARDVQL
jgi:hypothetical protein